MKRNKLAKKLTAALLSGAMVMSMGGMTAFANTGDDPLIPITEGKISFSKSITREENVLYPNTTFSFDIQPVGNAGVAIEGTSDPIIYGGIPNGLYFEEGDNIITVTPESTNLSSEISTNVDVFSKPGVYRYELSEDEGTYDGMTYDTTNYYLDLYVVNDSEGYKIDGVVAHSVDGEVVSEDKASDLVFENAYSTQNLTITKVVTGNQGNKSQEFSFTVTINGAEGEEYATNYELADGAGTLTLVSGTASETNAIQLSDGESIVIYGLSPEDAFTIVEDAANQDGYTTTFYTTYKGYGDEGNVTAEDTTEVQMGEESQTITVENNKNVTTPTGIAMTFAPYAVMVVFAGVFAVMFLRKKREEF